MIDLLFEFMAEKLLMENFSELIQLCRKFKINTVCRVNKVDILHNYRHNCGRGGYAKGVEGYLE